jgi:hypothetical protein
MAFDIAIDSRAKVSRAIDKRPPFVTGNLIIGNESEIIEIPLDFWSISEYMEQWIEAIIRLMRMPNSVLVLGMSDPSDPKHALYLWPMYRVKKLVYIQNKFVDYNDIPKPFLLQDIYNSVGDRKQYDDDGNLISEWCTTTDEIKEFLAVTKRGLKNKAD